MPIIQPVLNKFVIFLYKLFKKLIFICLTRNYLTMLIIRSLKDYKFYKCCYFTEDLEIIEKKHEFIIVKSSGNFHVFIRRPDDFIVDKFPCYEKASNFILLSLV